MPELVEVECYRRLAELVVGRRITRVETLDQRMLRGQPDVLDLDHILVGRTVTAARRIGKLLLLDTGASGRSAAPGPTVGLHFGMTGTLVVDGVPGVGSLLYGSHDFKEQWARFRMGFSGGRALELHDPRRLGRIVLDPTEARLGPDAASLRLDALRRLLGAGPGRSAMGGPALKARLMDQSRLAGVGNLIADELLWRASLAPMRPAGALSDVEIRRLHRHLRRTIIELSARGGSHTGDLAGERRPGGHCPRDGAVLSRSAVGGRTTWWCPAHQH